jgi:ribosome-binding ATPase YchF (GTP1/OBG family)
VKRDTLAPRAAGVIHTDFEKGFIMADVISFEDFKALGSKAAVREAGKLRMEGRKYEVQDGDIIE